MKKIILSIALVAFIFSMNAQIKIEPMDKALPKDPKSKVKFLLPKDERLLQQKDYKGLDDWIHTTDFLQYLKNNPTFTLGCKTLLPDTCLQAYITAGSFFPGLIGMGFMLDLCSPAFDKNFATGLLPTPPAFTYNYKLDTLEIWGLYQLGNKGYNTESPDTLRVYVTSVAPYREKTNHYIKIRFCDDQNTYLIPKMTVKGANQAKGASITPTSPNTKMIDYILQPDDTVYIFTEDSIRYSVITIPLTYNEITANGFEVPYGDALGVMVHFIPGYDYKLGDTLYWGEVIDNKWAEGYPIRINNQFSILYSEIEGEQYACADPFGFNNAIGVYKEHRYQMFTGGKVLFNEYYFPIPNALPYMFFKISVDEENGGIIKNDTDNVIEANNIVSNIYPNPANDNVSIQLKSEEPATITFYSILGQEVMSAILTDNQTTIDVSDLNRGLYIIKVKQKGQTFTSKISIF
ncbi:MAG TPA: T9SS type A sorting domain-containing protein [Bacteroidales bacterium]|nr:T9SS type A sorting domain-containing protein [Bacteroidales bacterium]HOR81157.1 T9SS type A sorting domain-containing protein [Bacteroidales bacterium]HPJ90721.1 T9SS type A sorting domain-containing protein [Bacteroidales bacterium]